MAKGRKTEKRSELAGRRFDLAVTLFTSSYGAIVEEGNYKKPHQLLWEPRWTKFVDYYDLKQIRKWAREGLPLKRVDQVAAFFGLEAQAFIDERIDERGLIHALYRMKPKVMAVGADDIPLERLEPSPVPDFSGQAVPDQFSNAFTAFMTDRLRHFCGRRFVFDALDAFLESNLSGNGYFLITGDPESASRP